MASRKQQKQKIGKGLEALLKNIDNQSKEETVQQLSSTVAVLPLSQIRPNPFQPRAEFDKQALDELSASIKSYGLIQPITVRRISARKYELISGERRLRASKLAGLKEIPAYIRLADDQGMMEMALVENIQRAELNPIEIALTYSRLQEEFSMTHHEIADRVGKGRITVGNYLSMLKLPDLIQDGIRSGEISAGHGRTIAKLEDYASQKELYQQVLDQDLSVRELENIVREYGKQHPSSQKLKPAKLPDSYIRVQDKLRKQFGIKKINVRLKGKESGSIVIPFQSNAELNDFLDRIDDV